MSRYQEKESTPSTASYAGCNNVLSFSGMMMLRIHYISAALVVAVFLVPVLAKAQAVSFASTPQNCVIPTGEDTCSVTLSWTTDNTSSASVWVHHIGLTDNAGPVAWEPDFTSVTVPWITGPGYVFDLHSTYEVSSPILESLAVAGTASVPSIPKRGMTLPATRTSSASASSIDSFAVSAANITFPSTPQFYSPDIMYDGGVYKMWTTAGDRVRYYTSQDGITWTGGQTVFSAQPGTWEDNGAPFEGYQGGISDPRVIKNVTPGWIYTMYYTAGADPNTSTKGGMGVAFSNDGMNWTRWSGNPLKSYPKGHTFVMQNLLINDKHYLYYLGGGSATQAPDLRVMEDLGNGVSFTDEKILPFNDFYPLLYDPQTNTCWLGQNQYSDGVTSGPTSIDIFIGSNCFTTKGVKIATISSADTGNVTNFGAYPKEVTSGEVGRSSVQAEGVQLFFSSGNEWGNWQPKSVFVRKDMSSSTPVVTPPAVPPIPTAATSSSPTARACLQITRNLSVGSRGADVMRLQQYLISQKFLASGNNTGYFGNLTQAAVQGAQRREGVVSYGTPTTTGYGSVGPRTRAALARCN